MSDAGISVLPDPSLRFLRWSPPARLTPYVAYYWAVEVVRAPATVRTVADGLVDVTFALSTAAGQPKDDGPWLTGPRDASATYRHDTPVRLFGVSLRPAAAAALLGIECDLLPPTWDPLEKWIGADAARLAEQLRTSPTHRARRALLDAFFRERLAHPELTGRHRATPVDRRVSAAVHALVATRGTASIPDVAAGSFTTARHLGRLFHRWVGMSPKRFARVVRAQAAVQRLAHEQATASRLAADLGFADQAHLARELRTLVGASATELSGRGDDRSEIIKP